MSFLTGYLTSREATIWDLRRKGNNQTEIGKLLGITRQAAFNTLDKVDKKIDQAFNEAADSNNLVVKKIDLVEGFMEAYSPAHRIPVFVSFSKANGLKIWYFHEGDCRECEQEASCLRYLRSEAEERGIKLLDHEWDLSPTILALKIFSGYMEGDPAEK